MPSKKVARVAKALDWKNEEHVAIFETGYRIGWIAAVDELKCLIPTNSSLMQTCLRNLAEWKKKPKQLTYHVSKP